MTSQFSQLSLELTRELNKEHKKENGIFFTPRKIIELSVKWLDLSHVKTLLEPSCGSCEFIQYLDTYLDSIQIDGIEKDDQIFNKIATMTSARNTLHLFHDDFLKHDFPQTRRYDLIIGNPPYYVIKKSEVDKQYHHLFEGRPNVYILFMIRALSLLNIGGILCFIIPINFTNCIYYNALRRHICQQYQILHLIPHAGDEAFIDTDQQTMTFIVQKPDPTHTIENQQYTVINGDFVMINTPDKVQRLKELYLTGQTLDQLGFGVKNGTIVWNQVKSELTDDPNETRLIYSTDLSEGQIKVSKFNNPEKKNYIHRHGDQSSCLVINRGYGCGQYVFTYCYVDAQMYPHGFLIENHLLIIYNDQNQLPLTALLKSFQDPRTHQFIDLYFGNNAINTTELKSILPIYV
uniref:site-specific DNA-methyltransferase (adenine-specific) n=1 Tax=viral metagenome TaxID=1070528 RepID=A0A6C0BJ98_9ZZZZ